MVRWPWPGRGSFERMTALDSTFLYVESDQTPMHIGALTVFEGGPFYDERGVFRLEQVRERVSERLHLVPKLRKRLATVPLGQGRPVWVDDETFDIANHVNLTVLPAPGSREQLAALCCTMQMQVLDRARPLWELWFVEGLDDGSIAMIERVHHTLVDGVSGVDVAAALFDIEPTPPPTQVPEWRPVAPPKPAQLLVGSGFEGLVHQAQWWRTARALTRTPAAATRVATGMVDALASQTGLLRRRPTLNGRIGGHRALHTVSNPLDEVRAAARASDATVNDAVLAIVGGAARALLEHRGDAVPHDLVLHVLVPVSIRSDGERGALGNRVSGILVPVPAGGSSIADRLAAVRDQMAAHKRRHQSSGIEFVLDGIELIPTALLPVAARVLQHQPLVDVVVTNVPGPPFPLYFMGAKALEAVPIVPLAGNLTNRIAVLSYAGTLTIGVYSDADSCPDVEVFVAALRAGFEDLADAEAGGA